MINVCNFHDLGGSRSQCTRDDLITAANKSSRKENITMASKKECKVMVYVQTTSCYEGIVL